MAKTPPNVRDLRAGDSLQIAAAFAAQGWDKAEGQFERYLTEASAGTRDVILAEINGACAGYVTIVWAANYAPFRQAAVPEIVDLNVLKRFQRRGIGSALLTEAEQRIFRRSAAAGIGVGLTADYGPAQIMYVKRGYLPDGRGIVTGGVRPAYGAQVRVDDDLVLYLTKSLVKG